MKLQKLRQIVPPRPSPLTKRAGNRGTKIAPTPDVDEEKTEADIERVVDARDKHDR